jgi:hypothetical protein
MRTAYDRRPDDEEDHEGESAVALDPEEARKLRRVAYAIAWGSVAIGMVLPLLLSAFHLGFDAFWAALVGPDHDMRLTGFFNGIGFISYGVFAYLYLHKAVELGRPVVKERMLGLSFAGVLMVAVSATVVWFSAPGNILLLMFLAVAFAVGFPIGRYMQDSESDPG